MGLIDMDDVKTVGLWWFITEAIQLIFIFFGGLLMFWLFTPYGVFVKFGISLLVGVIAFDVFRSFLYVR